MKISDRINIEAARHAVGIHRDWSEAEYFAFPALNHSLIDHGLRSMAHFYAELMNPQPFDSDAMRLGTAMHWAVFEPKRLETGCVRSEKFDRRTGEGKAAAYEFEKKNEGALILEPEAYEQLIGMRQSIARADRVRCRKLLEHAGPMEAAAVWIDPETGLPCKAKLDKFIPNVLALDLKTTIDASPDAFARAVARFGYHRQASWYIDGFRLATGEETPFTFVAIEKSPPFGVGLYSLGIETLGVGRSQNRRLLREIKASMESGVWADYPDEVKELELPKWALKLDEGGMPKIEDFEHSF